MVQGVTLSQFSFRIPKPLQENYVRKRTARLPGDSAYGRQGSLPTIEGISLFNVFELYSNETSCKGSYNELVSLYVFTNS